MIDTTEFYSLMPVQMKVTFALGSRLYEKATSSAFIFHPIFTNNLDEIEYATVICWFVYVLTGVILHSLYPRERNPQYRMS